MSLVFIWGHTPSHALLARGLTPGAAGRVMFWCAMLLIMALLMGLAAYIIRKRMTREGDAPSLPMGFSLSDLRQLHAQGQLSDEEFEHAKRKMVAKTRSALASDETTPSQPSGDLPLLNLDLPPSPGDSSTPPGEPEPGR